MRKCRRDFLRLTGHASVLAAGAMTAPHAFALARQSSLNEAPRLQDAESHPSRDLMKKIKAISNVFEVGRAEPDYSYVENLGDGRGFTVTQYGFCTYNDEVSNVISRYSEDVPATPLKRFLPHLPPRTHVVNAAALHDFPHVWKQEIRSSGLLANACDEEADKLYYRPAIAAAEAVGVHSAIGKAIFYDTWLQHGASSDPDSLPSILKRATDETGGIGASSEKDFLRAFLRIRKSVLHEPHNHATRDVWRASARRVDALLNLLERNPGLDPPVVVTNAEVHVVI